MKRSFPNFEDDYDAIKKYVHVYERGAPCNKQIFDPNMCFIAVDYFYIGVMYSCVKGHNSLQTPLTC